MIDKKSFIKGYIQGWYNNAQMHGEFLWDVDLKDFDGDLSEAKEAAQVAYSRL